MQAVHTIGSTHVQRTARKRNYLAMSVAKKLAIPALLIFAFIFVVFIPTGADTLDNMPVEILYGRTGWLEAGPQQIHRRCST